MIFYYDLASSKIWDLAHATCNRLLSMPAAAIKMVVSVCAYERPEATERTSASGALCHSQSESVGLRSSPARRTVNCPLLTTAAPAVQQYTRTWKSNPGR